MELDIHCDLLTARHTGIESSSEKIISSRFQDHSFIGPNGLLHVVVNSGHSFDFLVCIEDAAGVLSWKTIFSISGISSFDTSDLAMSGNSLYFVYTKKGKTVKLHRYDYNDNDLVWRNNEYAFERALFIRKSGSRLKSPSILLDAAGKLSFSVSRVKSRNGRSRAFLYVSPLIDGDVMERRSGPYLKLKAPPNVDNMSGHLVESSSGLGLITLESSTSQSLSPSKMRWHSLDINETAGAFEILETNVILRKSLEQNDPSGTHYAVLTTPGGSVHLLTNDGAGSLKYAQKIGSADWKFIDIDDSLTGVNYMNLSLLRDDTLVAYSVARGESRGKKNLYLHASSNNGDSWEQMAVCGGEYLGLGEPRIEAPSYGLDRPKVFQQIDLNYDQQSLILWEELA